MKKDGSAPCTMANNLTLAMHPFVEPSTQQILSLKTWFTSFDAIYTWGGPNMTYPMSDQDFLALVTVNHMKSYALINDEIEVLAFGQYYNRLDRHHLCRIGVNPKYRGQGLAKKLISQLLAKARQNEGYTAASLFVFKTNLVAYNCYLSMGFEVADYPGPIPGNMQNVVFMVLPGSRPG